jgi:beta-lactamase class A
MSLRSSLKFNWKATAKYVGIFILGAGIASLLWYEHLNVEIAAIAAEIKPMRQANNSYEFINPLLGFDVPSSIQEFDEYQPLATTINNLVASESSSAPDAFGFYFRDLTLGRWTGINETTGFAPGSMMKVVLMIAYFKEAESDPSILQKVLIYSSSTADQLNGIPFETPSDLQVGQGYTVDQLIEAMIKSSDNGAKNALLDDIDPTSLGEISSDLGFSYLDVTQDYSTYTISAKQYSVILKALYNATYLSRAYSEKALQILSQAEYNQGLVAGVPGGVVVAQKFGESVNASSTGASVGMPEITLSNCGIVYHPTHPYLICVMTEGKNLANLTQTISAISQATWDAVNGYSTSQALGG